MNFVERALTAIMAFSLVAVLSGCGGGNSTQTTITGGASVTVASVDVPTGPNTTQIVVDSGPSSFSVGGAPNVPYVTVTICSPNSSSACVTIDHVVLDTGSIGLRVLKSKVAGLSLQPVTVAGGTLAECYGFVLGQLWGPLASADVRIGGERAPAIPIQIIDDGSPMAYSVPTNCYNPLDPNQADKRPMNSAAALQANGILGVGMLPFDCGLDCLTANAKSYYYACPDASSCAVAAAPRDQQAQNPVVHFVANSNGSIDNNGTMIVLPSVPDLGAGKAIGRLVFGIGTQTNNQMPLTTKMYFVGVDPASTGTYLSLSTTVGATRYGDSYIDSGSNAFFFDDASIAQGCKSSSGSTGGWYCPATVLGRVATVSDYPTAPNAVASGQVSFSIGNADALFSSPSTALSNLGGTVNQGPNTFVWGLPFFYGRTVFTSIWGQSLALNGPWNAF